MALLQCIFIITLQALICSQNTLQADLLPESADYSNILSSTTSNADTIPVKAKDRLGRIKWENIAFMGFQAWFFGMAVDAVRMIKYILIFCNICLIKLYRLSIKIQLKSWFWEY